MSSSPASDQLGLVCPHPNKRPVISEGMRRQAAEQLVERLLKVGAVEAADTVDSVNDLVKATRSERHDGYKIARELERLCHWDCDMLIAEELDVFDDILDHVYKTAEKRWAVENPMTPEFQPREVVVWRGKAATVHGFYEFRPHCYRLTTAECVQPNSYFVVPFEDVKKMEQ